MQLFKREVIYFRVIHVETRTSEAGYSGILKPTFAEINSCLRAAQVQYAIYSQQSHYTTSTRTADDLTQWEGPGLSYSCVEWGCTAELIARTGRPASFCKTSAALSKPFCNISIISIYDQTIRYLWKCPFMINIIPNFNLKPKSANDHFSLVLAIHWILIIYAYYQFMKKTSPCSLSALESSSYNTIQFLQRKASITRSYLD